MRKAYDDTAFAMPTVSMSGRPVPGLSRLLLRSGIVSGARAEPSCAYLARSALLSTSPSGSERSRAITPMAGPSPLLCDDDGSDSDSVWPTFSEIAAALAHPCHSTSSQQRGPTAHADLVDRAADGSQADPFTDSVPLWPTAAQIAAVLSALQMSEERALQSEPSTTSPTCPKQCLQPSFWMKTGLAVKQGGFYPSWKRRLFALDGRALRYFRPSDRAERGVIPLGHISRVCEMGEEIHVVTSQRTFKFVSDDCENSSWVQAIEHNRRVLKGTPRMLQAFGVGCGQCDVHVGLAQT